MENSDRKNSIPVLYVSGNFYECGYEMGRNFASLIQTFLETSQQLNSYLLPIYSSSEGRAVYEDTLNIVRNKFPQYVREIEGIADGARVDVHKLMLFHFDEILPNVTNQRNSEIESSGCSTIYVKTKDSNILGHTEDAAAECLNNFYIVCAHVVPEGMPGREEKFTALCYPGHIGGYTMGYNSHGLVFTINTLVARKLLPKKTPRHFITRALLTSKSYDEAIEILKDEGVGLADGFSINLKFLSEKSFCNIEMGPAYEGNISQMDIKEVIEEGSMIHCNHYLRMKIEQYDDNYLKATRARYETLSNFPDPGSKEDVIKMLSDTSHKEHCVFRAQSELSTKTICVGIFDFMKRTWSLYKTNPKTNSLPLIVLTLNIDDQ